jgi:ABC-type transport system involved in multi-copper enzyme maturation permease subunit
MINTIKIISKKEFSYLLKEKTFLYAVGIFIVMAILSTVI